MNYRIMTFVLSLIQVFLGGFIATSCNGTYDIDEPDGVLFEDPFYEVSRVGLFATNSIDQQSAAVYGDYCVMVTNKRRSLSLYNLSTKKMLLKLDMEPGEDYDYMGYDLFHSNQATFGVDFYAPQDPFPLLYISQRARDDLRCFVEVFRILPMKEESDSDYSSMEVSLVQTIYFPVMSESNCMGNVNCVIDHDSRQMYTYSRNNNILDSNYGICKISCFDIPVIDQEVIVMNDSDIKSSFMLNCNAINMQGGCINDGVLYIGQGYKSAGYIILNVIDLKRELLISQTDLLRIGVDWEPEGCFFYDGKVMISAGTSIWELVFSRGQ